MLDTYGRKYFDKAIDQSATFFLKMHLSPTHVTILAFIIGILGALLLSLNFPVLCLLFLWVSGSLDAIDGSMARLSGMSSPIGTLLDICFDRVVEICFILCFAMKYPQSILPFLFATCAIVLSMTVFLTSGMLLPNTGKKSFQYQAGLMERTEGFLLFSCMILFPSWIHQLAILYGSLILYTAIQRFYMAYKFLRGE